MAIMVGHNNCRERKDNSVLMISCLTAQFQMYMSVNQESTTVMQTVCAITPKDPLFAPAQVRIVPWSYL